MMPDISMCMSKDCPSRKDCYRHHESGTKPSERRQSYMSFEPKREWGMCDWFLRKARDTAQPTGGDNGR